MKVHANKRYRLTRRDDISRIFERGRQASDGLITLFALPNDDPTGRSRLGVGVSKGHGCAVRRNRIKRLCREAFRTTRTELPGGWDFMIVPRVGCEFSADRLQKSIRSLAARLIRHKPEGG